MASMFRSLAIVCALSLSTGVAQAGSGPAGSQGEGPGAGLDRPQREAVMKKIHTGFVLELAEILGFDTPATIKLSARLEPFNEKRIALRLDSRDAMEKLRKIAKGHGEGDVVALARRIAQNRVESAQVDQQEMEELIKGLTPEQTAKAAVFVTEFPHRVERMAREILDERGGWGHSGGSPDQAPRGGHWGDE
jgi:hypothetical protein